jgi:hypothetical protein
MKNIRIIEEEVDTEEVEVAEEEEVAVVEEAEEEVVKRNHGITLLVVIKSDMTTEEEEKLEEGMIMHQPQLLLERSLKSKNEIWGEMLFIFRNKQLEF